MRAYGSLHRMIKPSLESILSFYSNCMQDLITSDLVQSCITRDLFWHRSKMPNIPPSVVVGFTVSTLLVYWYSSYSRAFLYGSSKFVILFTLHIFELSNFHLILILQMMTKLVMCIICITLYLFSNPCFVECSKCKDVGSFFGQISFASEVRGTCGASSGSL